MLSRKQSLKFKQFKKIQFNGKKGDICLMWKIKFEADMVMKGLYKAFQPEFDAELHMKE